MTLNDALRPLSDPEEIKYQAVCVLGKHLGTDRAYYVEIDEAHAEFVVARDWHQPGAVSHARRYPLEGWPMPWLVDGQPWVVRDVDTDPAMPDDQRASYRGNDIGALIVVPLIKRNRLVATLATNQHTPRDWLPDEIMFVQETADRTWAAVERARVEAIVAADLQDMQRLRELGARLVIEDNIQTLYQEIMAAAIALTRADAGTVQILDEATQELVLLAAQGFEQTMLKHFYRLNESSNTPCGIALKNGKRSFVDFDVPERENPDESRRILMEAGYLSGQSTPLTTRSGKIIGMVSTHWRDHHRPSERELRFLDLLARQAADLIEQRQTANEREKLFAREQAARAEADRANRIKDEFLAVLSHELRSPLNPILGWAKLLRGGKLDSARTAGALATIERNAKLQSQLIDDLLDISRIMQGKLALNATPVSLAFVISSAIETVRLAAEVKGIRIEVQLEPNIGQVYGDAGRLQQVVWNLLSNAVKFTPTGGRVEVRLTQVNDQARLQVIDTGKGIQSEFLPYVFEHFRQEDGATTRKFGGLGLGLAIARQIVELHGGGIWVESMGEGQGATFTVELPFLQTGNSVEAMIDPILIQSDPLPLANLRVLIVDDELDSREFVVFVVEQAGAEVTAVNSAIEALQQLSTTSFDLLLSDIGMPEMDGYELMRQISQPASEPGKQISTLAQPAVLPAIAITAYAGEMNQQQALAVGFQGHISKPVEPDELIKAIVTMMG